MQGTENQPKPALATLNTGNTDQKGLVKMTQNFLVVLETVDLVGSKLLNVLFNLEPIWFSATILILTVISLLVWFTEWLRQLLVSGPKPRS
jgi:hypothetical protein